MNGIDVSYAQSTPINWLRVAMSGNGCVIIRAGYGNDVSQQDDMFANHIAGAIRAGMAIAVYWMAYPVDEDDALAEWAACKKVIAPYLDKIKFVAYDYEGASREYYAKEKGKYPDRDTCSAMVNAFLRAEEADGFKPVLYINNDFRRNYITAEVLTSCDLWLADPDGGPDVPCAIQQTGSGPVEGAVGNIDHDIVFDESLFADPKPVVTDVPAADITYFVRAGGVWLPKVTNLQDYAGSSRGLPITGVCMCVSKGSIKYRAHEVGGSWLPFVTGCDPSDFVNGYAGNNNPIDAIEIYYYTPDGDTPVRYSKYHVAPSNSDYYSWQLDNQTSNGQDGYAGVLGVPIARLQIQIV